MYWQTAATLAGVWVSYRLLSPHFFNPIITTTTTTTTKNGDKMTTKKTVLITGCSAGGMGAALAQAFHKSGLHVIATARNPTKMAELAALGIETLTLDVLDEASIAAAVSKVPKLDMLSKFILRYPAS